MSYSDLLNRMMEKDTDAFLELTDCYGWALYSEIRKKHSDKTVADRIYNETMNRFYHCLQNSSCDDPVEALLCEFAEQISAGSVSNNIVSAAMDEAPPHIQLHHAPKETVAKNRISFWTILGILLVFAGISVTIWIIAGFLMVMQAIPFVDLGHSWFYTQIENMLTYFNIL